VLFILSCLSLHPVANPVDAELPVWPVQWWPHVPLAVRSAVSNGDAAAADANVNPPSGQSRVIADAHEARVWCGCCGRARCCGWCGLHLRVAQQWHSTHTPRRLAKAPQSSREQPAMQSHWRSQEFKPVRQHGWCPLQLQKSGLGAFLIWSNPLIWLIMCRLDSEAAAATSGACAGKNEGLQRSCPRGDISQRATYRD
jgi:hypothetical protein